jgi:Multiubiquitin
LSTDPTEHGADEDSEKAKSVTIIVDGTPHEWAEKEISYEQVVDLAYDGNPPTGPMMEITVGYHRGHGDKPEGDLERGTSVKVKDGMVFDVTATDRS